MSRIFLVVSVVSLAFAFSADTTLGQCDASPGIISGVANGGGCGCSTEINQCGNQGRLFSSGGGCNGGCSLGNGRLGNIGGVLRGGGCNGGCGGGCNAAPAPSCGCSGGGCASGGCSGGGLLSNVGGGGGCGGCGGGAAAGGRGLCGLFSDITGFSMSVTQGQTGCGCGGGQAQACGGGCGCGGSNSYYKLMAGWNSIGDDDELEGLGTTNEGFLLGFARGKRINCNTRFEFESSWRNNSGNFAGATPLDGRINVFSPTINLYRDFGSGSLRPYVGGGIGIAYQDAEFVTGEVDDFAFAYQAAIGLALNTQPGKDWFVEYRYYGNTDTDLELGGATIGEVSYDATNLIFGFRQSF